MSKMGNIVKKIKEPLLNHVPCPSILYYGCVQGPTLGDDNSTPDVAC